MRSKFPIYMLLFGKSFCSMRYANLPLYLTRFCLIGIYPFSIRRENSCVFFVSELMLGYLDATIASALHQHKSSVFPAALTLLHPA